MPSPVDVGICADQDDPTRYAVVAGQARLGLPTRDYYLLKGDKYDAIRKAYRAVYRRHRASSPACPIRRAAPTASSRSKRGLSKDQWTPERRRDPVATHNPMTRAQLMKLAPQFDWTDDAALDAGSARRKKVDVAEPSAVAAAGKRLADVPLSTWKEYLTFRFISDHANYLPKAFDDARFDFYGKTLNDVPEQRARWKRGMRLLDDSLGEAVGPALRREHWPAETARQAQELVADMRAAYAREDRERVVDGRGDAQGGAREARHLRSAHRPSGQVDRLFRPEDQPRPIRWPTTSRPRTSSGSCSSSASRNPVDRTLWDMTPQTVNAYYDPTMNQITVPAAILQPPFFDANADPAVNYAETGATTIGHEMGHGFDDQGRQYDAKGRLRDWWTPATAAKYKVKADRLATQFDQYEPIPGVHIKGKLTLGENLADLGGLETAYAAYRRYVARHGEPPVIDGFTGDQRFFIAYAQAWQGKRARRRAARSSCSATRTARRSTGSTASSAISTPGTRRSTCSPATSSICRPSSASTSGRRL